jgi:hypothetical protein
MSIDKIEEGDVVQLDPVKTSNPNFQGCMLTVSEVKPWGVMGYVQSLGEDGKMGGQAYYRAETGTYEYVGRSVWVMAERDHWKANHDNMVARLAIATQRPDLPVDRIPAIKELERLQAAFDRHPASGYGKPGQIRVMSANSGVAHWIDPPLDLAAQIAKGYNCGTLVTDPEVEGATLQLHYATTDEAQDAFAAIADAIDKAIARKA